MRRLKRTISDHSRLLRSFPELAMIDDPQVRFTVWTIAYKAAVTGSGIIYILALIMIGAFNGLLVAGAITLPMVGPWIRSHSYIGGVLAGSSAPLALVFIVRLRRRRIEQSLRKQLNDRGLAVCMRCGYDLRGQIEPRCPECGAVFDSTLLNDKSSGGEHEN